MLHTVRSRRYVAPTFSAARRRTGHGEADLCGGGGGAARCRGRAWRWPPASASAAPGDATTFVFARGVDDAVWVRVLDQSTGAWQPWQSLGGAVTGTPYGELMPDGRVAVFGRGVDGALWTRSTSDLVNWSGWESLGGQMLDDPVVVFTPWITGPGEPDVMVFARGLDFRAVGAVVRRQHRFVERVASRVSRAGAGTGDRVGRHDDEIGVRRRSVHNDRRQVGLRAALNASGTLVTSYSIGRPGVTESPVLSNGQGAHVGFVRMLGNQLGGFDSLTADVAEPRRWAPGRSPLRTDSGRCRRRRSCAAWTAPRGGTADLDGHHSAAWCRNRRAGTTSTRRAS